MKATFILNEAPCQVFGKWFIPGAEVDVSDLPAAQQAKLANNPTFTVSESEAPAKAKPHKEA